MTHLTRSEGYGEASRERRAHADRRQQAALDRARRVATVLDESIELPVVNYRIGLDPLLGVLPVAGDAVAAAISLYVVFEAFRAGAPVWLLIVMAGIVAVDFVGGSVPVVGVVFDAVWKANRWNVALLERYVEG